MSSLYDSYILPKITNVVCSAGPNMQQREKIVPSAFGIVLEIGAGSGLNFRYYDPERVNHLFALDPSEEMWKLAGKHLDAISFEVEYIKSSAESIPLESHSVDSVVSTYTMCSIPDLDRALSEMWRVLKPDGRLIFCEHGRAPDRQIIKWQNFLTPAWKMVSGGCHLNRNIPELIEQAGFSIEQLHTMYLTGFKVASYNYRGMAKPAKKISPTHETNEMSWKI